MACTPFSRACFLFLAVTSLLAARIATGADKPETWIEVRTPHFTVVSNGNEKQARRVADHFEQIRAVMHLALPKLRVDPGQAIVILAVRNENSLKALLPGYWEVKGHLHPAGVFVAGQEKHYVALRTDTEGENPYHVIYHEYVHAILNLNFRNLPLWFEEGMAEFYGDSTIGDKEIGLGRPDPSHLWVLGQNKLIPIEVLLQVDPSSPYYNEQNRASIFYSESWALFHYLQTEPERAQKKALSTFVNVFVASGDQLKAAREAFGDLKQLDSQISDYVRQTRFRYYLMKTSANLTEKDVQVRSVPAAESLALRGDFHMHVNRPVEARALLEEALRVNADLPLVHESLGFLFYRENQREEAAREFDKAVALDSKSYLAHYYHAFLMLQNAMRPEVFADAQKSLERAIQLNPNFAPAYAALSSLYGVHDERLEDALAAARKAAELEPGDAAYYLNVGMVLLRMGRIEEAHKVGQDVLAAAKTPQEKASAEVFAGQVERFQDAQKQRTEESAEERAAREQVQEYLRREPTPGEGKDPAGADAGSPTPPEAGKAPRTTARIYSMLGRMEEASCSANQALDLTLTMGGTRMRLHSDDVTKINFFSTTWKPPANFNPCVHLRGLTAVVSYRLVKDQSFDGLIWSIEIRR